MASTQLVQALTEEHALAIVALDRDSSHLAEQMALKCFVPVVSLSRDTSLTSANIPWIFRLPQGATPAEALRFLQAASLRSEDNPGTIRRVLASGTVFSGISFLPSGEARL